ncbi:cytochrome P450 89A2-like [Cynara cardunculus var. scolymus]|uniref:cytochrome P450 89A2-like n=1 Tax=Cynara cardunculus var. scolymus TaxID=59895 RepID=UPI000D62D539|nr:cytochrome P450 89A2-like [Cynara cardunculus var. scolymus]
MDLSFFLLLLLTLSVATLISILVCRKTTKNLPPGPSFFSSNLLLLTTSLSELGPIIRNLKSKYGTLLTLSIGSHPSIFVADHTLAHQVLIQKGAIFSDRPQTIPVRNISSAAYGPTWRLLRRNLTAEVLHPSRVKSYSWARKWVLQILIGRLQERKPAAEEAAGIITVVDHFRYAMFCLLVFMCFGEKLDDRRIDEIATVQRRVLLSVGSGRFNVLSIFPRLGKILFRNRWKEVAQIRNDQEQVLLPLIKSRIETANSETESVGDDDQIVAYVDTLINLHIPEVEATNGNGGNLTEKEMVSMCDEFLNAGTDTTSTALQWIMANLVKHPHIQSKLYDEIITVVGPPPPPPPPGVEPESVINEDDLQKMPYLKAVVLEGLRRHPPGHFLLPHRVAKEVEVEGYKIPEGASINFLVAEMGRDPKVWDDPMEFKPERFLMNGVFDITGSKGIKMMPFGAGRRICPGYDLALLHLEYFVANLIWFFRWTVAGDCDVDLSEKAEFTIVMKNPLQTRIFPRTEI